MIWLGPRIRVDRRVNYDIYDISLVKPRLGNDKTSPQTVVRLLSISGQDRRRRSHKLAYRLATRLDRRAEQKMGLSAAGAQVRASVLTKLRDDGSTTPARKKETNA